MTACCSSSLAAQLKLPPATPPTLKPAVELILPATCSGALIVTLALKAVAALKVLAPEIVWLVFRDIRLATSIVGLDGVGGGLLELIQPLAVHTRTPTI